MTDTVKIQRKSERLNSDGTSVVSWIDVTAVDTNIFYAFQFVRENGPDKYRVIRELVIKEVLDEDKYVIPVCEICKDRPQHYNVKTSNFTGTCEPCCPF